MKRFGAPFLEVATSAISALLVGTGCATSGSRSGGAGEPSGSAAVTDSVSAEVSTSKPRQPDAHYTAARAALAEGDRETASVEVKLAIQRDPIDAESHYLLACLLQEEGRGDQAMVGFRRTLSLDPSHADALFNLGTMLLWRGEAIPASRLLESAITIRPEHLPSYNNLAKAYFLTGFPELAIGTYEEALRFDPSNVIALANLVLVAEAAGMVDAADEYRRRLAALGSVLPTRPRSDPASRTDPVASAFTGAAADAIEPSNAPIPANESIDDPELTALRELLRDLPHVVVERRGGRITLTGWTSGVKEREMLDRILGRSSLPPAKGDPLGTPPDATGTAVAGKAPDNHVRHLVGGVDVGGEILDLTTDDTGDPQRMLEIDAVLFVVRRLDSQRIGFDLLKEINLNFNYFASDLKSDGSGFLTPGTQSSIFSQPTANGNALVSTTGPIDDVNNLSQSGWMFGAAVDYVIDIANATDNRIAVLAQPHLTALSGTAAKFLAGGEIIFQVSGINNGDIKPYPFGTSLTVTPTLLRTLDEGGTPRVHVEVEAARTSILSAIGADSGEPVIVDKISVNSEAVLRIGQSLILSGLSQRESQSGRSGFPVLMDIPIIKWFFSTDSTIVSDSAVIILLTPRDAAFLDERNRKARSAYVEKRRAFLRARQGTPEDMDRFRETYPDWDEFPPNRFASHFMLLETSQIYRALNPQDLSSEDVDLEILGPYPIEK